MQKIRSCLWFDNQAEEAANFYCSIFKDSKILEITRYGEGAPQPAGTVLVVVFEIEGQQFMGLNGGPQFRFNEAVSFYVNCETQSEVDELWDKLSSDGEESQCGWLKDKYGVSWQIIPSVLPEMLSDPDPEKSQNVMAAMLKMQKIDIQALRDAYEQA